jgi:cytochrome c-type biogenesis protein CcmH/NrfF
MGEAAQPVGSPVPPAPEGDPQAHAGAPPRDPVQAEALTNELSHDLMSPYCPGRTIATCPSPQARKLEMHILDQAQQGKSRAEIETALAERFPDIRG